MEKRKGVPFSKERINMQLVVITAVLVLLMLFFSVNTKNFLSSRNLINVALQTSIAIILAIAETYVIITGGIDLSIGSISAAAGMITAICLNRSVPVPAAILAGIAAGVLCGAFNAFTITVLGIVPFIATLGTNSIMRGLIYVMLNGIPLSASSAGKAFTWIGQDKLGGWLPYPVLFMTIIAVICVIVLTKTKFGRMIFAIGSNENTAFLSGIKVNAVKFKVYLLSGFLCSVAGVILTSRVASASPTAGQGDETFAIAAAVIGGASLSGGKGNMVGTIIGAFIIGILNNGLNLIGLSSFWQQVAVGCVIILAVFMDTVRVKLKNQ